jgi:Fe-S oxidoreductase
MLPLRACSIWSGFPWSRRRAPGCCGALRYHLNDQDGGRRDMRALIDAWWPGIESGEIEAIVMTASGCGSTVREYGHLLADDPHYAERAARVSTMTRDLSEILERGTPCRSKAFSLRSHRRANRWPTIRPVRCSMASRCADWLKSC